LGIPPTWYKSDAYRALKSSHHRHHPLYASPLHASPPLELQVDAAPDNSLLTKLKEFLNDGNNPYKVLASTGLYFYLPLVVFFNSTSYGILLSLFAFYRIMSILASAHDRGRLDSSTFKWLNLGIALSGSACVLQNCFGMGAITFDLNNILVGSSALTSALTLKKTGLPQLNKLKFKGEKGSCVFTAFTYTIAGLSTFTNIAWSFSTIPLKIVPGVLHMQSILFPIAYLALTQATLGRRLSSSTYKSLNWTLLICSIVDVWKGGFAFPLQMLSTIGSTVLGLQNGYNSNKTE
jgi:hypothetical protein